MARFNRGLLFAGIAGALAGIYVMNKLDGTRTERRLRYQGRSLMRNARRQMGQISNIYNAGKAAVREGISVLRH